MKKLMGLLLLVVLLQSCRSGTVGGYDIIDGCSITYVENTFYNNCCHYTTTDLGEFWDTCGNHQIGDTVRFVKNR
jgi:hypothetical protein